MMVLIVLGMTTPCYRVLLEYCAVSVALSTTPSQSQFNSNGYLNLSALSPSNRQ